MSGTLNQIFSKVSYGLNIHTREIMKLQEQAATGSRINRASDDPSAAYRVLGLNSQSSTMVNYIDIIGEAVDTLELSNTIVQDVADSLADAKLLISQVTSGTYDDEARERTAGGINDILEQVVFLTNTEHNGKYIFGGNDTSSSPYVASRTNGQITDVSYQGGGESRFVEVAPSVNTEVFYSGDDIFRIDEREEPVFEGVTGAQSGTGTSSVQGHAWLTVEDDGAGSYRISIDDGLSYTAVPAGGLANQAVTDSRTGEVLYVDTTQITSTGIELVKVPGTSDVFDTLIMVRDIFANERNLSESQIRELQSSAIESFDEIEAQLVENNVLIGSRLGFLEGLKDTLTNIKYNIEDETTGLEEADISQIAIDLSQREVLYQMSLSVAGKIMSMSLLDFIQ